MLPIAPGLRLILVLVAVAAFAVACVSLSNGAPGSLAKAQAAKQQSIADANAANHADRDAAAADAAVARAKPADKEALKQSAAQAHAGAAAADARRTTSDAAARQAEADRLTASGSVYFAWYGFLAVAFLYVISAALAGDVNPLALAMGADNALSTSKFQALLWTACVGFVYAMIYADRVIAFGDVSALTEIPNNVLFALGLSVTSVVGAKAITSSQVAANPGHKEVAANPSYDPSALVRDDGSSSASISKVQILFWTVVAIVVYVTNAFHVLPQIAGWGPDMPATLPDIDTTLMIFMGLGHATYLGGKLVGGSDPVLSKVMQDPADATTLVLTGSSLGSSGTVRVNGTDVDPGLIQSWTPTMIRFTLADAPDDPWAPGDRIAIDVLTANAGISPSITYIYKSPPATPASKATAPAAVPAPPGGAPVTPGSTTAPAIRPPGASAGAAAAAAIAGGAVLAPKTALFTAPPPKPATQASKTLRWGVDTSTNVTRTGIDAATAQIAKPAFWGRYLTGFPIADGELALLAAEKIRLLPIYQGTTAHSSLLSGDTSGQQGAADAAAAVARARDTYRIPTHAGIAIYADIEPTYEVSHYWLSAWIADVTAAGYVAGIYCGSNQPGIIAGMSKLGHVNPASLILWSCMPHDTTKTTKADVPASIDPPGFDADGTSFAIDMWQYCLDFGDFDFNVCSSRAFDAMWQP